MARKPPVPEGVNDRAATFWRARTSKFEFNPSELVLMTEIVRVMTRVDELTVILDEQGPMGVGSKGQQIVNPVLGEIRAQELVLHRLVGSLNLPGEQSTSAQSARGRKASESRWSADQLSEARMRRRAGA